MHRIERLENRIHLVLIVDAKCLDMHSHTSLSKRWIKPVIKSTPEIDLIILLLEIYGDDGCRWIRYHVILMF